MAEDDTGWERLIAGLRQGDQQVMNEFCAQYGDRLHRLAAKRMGGKLGRRVGPEDVVQSAYRTFIRRAQGGEFQLGDSDSLWRLLCAITMKKLYQKARSNRRQRRDYDREVHPGSEGDDAGYDPVDRQPLPDEEAAYADELKDLFGSLDDEEKRVVELKLEGCTNEEAAERMGSSERTVRRIVKRIQNMLERRFDGIANS
jgi:RNA polymerase sigma-70 factor (ECF subfamily)